MNTPVCKQCGKPVGMRNGLPRVFCSVQCNLDSHRNFYIKARNKDSDNYQLGNEPHKTV